MEVWRKFPVAPETHLVVIFLAPECVVRTEILDNALRVCTESLAHGGGGRLPELMNGTPWNLPSM